MLLRDLRSELRKILVQKVQNPDVDLSKIGESVVDAVSQLLASEAAAATASTGTANGTVSSTSSSAASGSIVLGATASK